MRAAIKAGVVYAVLVFAAGFVLGIARTMLLVPNFGETCAVLVELPFMLAISWAMAKRLIGHFAVSPDAGARLAVGLLGFVLLLSAEFGLAIGLVGRTPSEFIGALATPAGVLGLAGQVLFGLFPLLQRR